MIEIKLTVDEIDYDSIAELLVPLLAEKMQENGGLMGKVVGINSELATKAARKLLHTMSQEKKDELVVELLTKKREVLMEKGTNLAKKKGIGMLIKDISVTKR